MENTKTATKTKTKAKTTTETKTKRKTRVSKTKKKDGLDIKVKLEDDRIIKSLIAESTFINETQLNEKMINDFYKFYKRKIKRSDFYSLIFCSLILIAIGINFLIEGSEFFFGIIVNIVISGFLIALGIYLLVYDFKYQKYNKKESKKIYDDDISKFVDSYYFNDERVVIKNKIGTTERTYERLNSVFETKNFYYILVTENSGFVMKKDSFTKGNEKDFHNFIKAKMGKSFKKS